MTDCSDHWKSATCPITVLLYSALILASFKVSHEHLELVWRGTCPIELEVGLASFKVSHGSLSSLASMVAAMLESST